MVVQSFGALRALTDTPPSYWPTASNAVSLYGHTQAYTTIYSTQPNVRTCADFLARNIAELRIQAFRRVSDTDRERLADHELIGWLEHPNPTTTRYRLFEALVGDLAIYFNAAWLKVRDAGRIGLVRMPPEELTINGGILPSSLTWTRNGKRLDLALADVVRFDGYNPLNPLMGLSPLETLRRVLAEELAAGEHREQFWRNASRQDGIIERPATAPKWTDPQKKMWREQWQQRFAGAAGAGMVPVLEDGMTFKAATFSPRDAEYTAARKLTREECAAAYHIPLPMVGILEHATFSNIKEQHKHLYQDCLGPWLRMIKEEIERQLLVECADVTGVYTEFNIDAKLAGSFEERANALKLAIGRAWLTVNEGRAIENLPRIDDPEMDTVAPQQGGPAAAPAPPPEGVVVDAVPPPADDAAAAAAPVLRFARTRLAGRLLKYPAADRPAALARIGSRWTRELTADLAEVMPTDAAAKLADATFLELNARTVADAAASRKGISA